MPSVVACVRTGGRSRRAVPPDVVPSEAEIAAAVDRLLASDDAEPIETWPPLNAGDRALDHPVNPPGRIA